MLPSGFVIEVIKLLSLVTFSGGFRIISDEDDCSVKTVSCPCGNQGYNITINIHICTNYYSNKTPKCKSCFSERNAQESCKRFAYCQKCVTGYNKCMSCPKGHEGILCEKENAKPIGYLKKRRKPRDHTCEMPPSPSPGRVSCTIDEDKMLCTGTCRKGFIFPDGTSERTHECNNLNGRWSPQEYFPECEPVDNCAVQLAQPASSYDCNHTQEYSTCRIQCGSSTRLYRCSLEGVWSPSLPSCVTSVGLSSSVPKPESNCRCQNGGRCERGRCICTAEYEGLYCTSRKRQSCPDLGHLHDGQQINRGSSIIYSCNRPYQLIGEATITCNDGTWNAPKPSCVAPAARSCPDLGPLENGQHNIRGNTITYSCDRPYELNGDASILCNTDDGTWSSSKPVCLAPLPSRPAGSCGISDSPRTPYITNGNASNIGQWPWHAAISRYEDARQAWEIICGASLISQRYVITAAHCVTRDRSSSLIDSNYLTIYLGKYYYSFDRDDDYVQITSVRQIVIHPKYNPTRFDADIALVQLRNLADYSPRVHPICLPSSSTSRRFLSEGNMGLVTGWGFDERGRTPDVLQQAQMPVVSKRNCEEGYREAGLDLTITENMYCAGYERGRIDICSGDSGGPMVFYDDSSRTWFLEGIVSWGSVSGCGRSKQYGGYTRVQRFINWIQEYL